MQATIFGCDIQLRKHTLSTLKKYFISNALVTPIKPEHRIVNNEYQWTIHARTVVQDALEDEVPFMRPEFSFVPFYQLYKYMDCLAHVGKICLI